MHAAILNSWYLTNGPVLGGCLVCRLAWVNPLCGGSCSRSSRLQQQQTVVKTNRDPAVLIMRRALDPALALQLLPWTSETLRLL